MAGGGVEEEAGLDQAEDLARDVDEDPYPKGKQRVVDLLLQELLISTRQFVIVFLRKKTASGLVPSHYHRKLSDLAALLHLILVKNDQHNDTHDGAEHIKDKILYLYNNSILYLSNTLLFYWNLLVFSFRSPSPLTPRTIPCR